jgi:hypothetical protein
VKNIDEKNISLFTIGVYGGCGSSIDCNDYLKDLVEEIKLIEADGGVLLQQNSNQMERGQYSKSTSIYSKNSTNALSHNATIPIMHNPKNATIFGATHSLHHTDFNYLVSTFV